VVICTCCACGTSVHVVLCACCTCCVVYMRYYVCAWCSHHIMTCVFIVLYFIYVYVLFYTLSIGVCILLWCKPDVGVCIVLCFTIGVGVCIVCQV